ncbi:MAG: hypothetical protein KIT09_07025 [Bryobacteraceae bacterium]|nr:hypothetical protein [Bryobacteraceae bacterium]
MPDELFTNREVNWHEQQLGRKGLVAAAGLFLPGDRSALVTLLQSDLCQQIFRHPVLRRLAKTKLDKWFKHWYRPLTNALLDFCLDHQIDVLYSPTSTTVLRHVRRPVAPELFRRIYDDVSDRYECFRQTLYDAEYWCIPVQPNCHRIAPLSPLVRPQDAPLKGICLFHDIEEDVDTPVSRRECRENLLRMLELERQAGVRVTYSVLGALFTEKRPVIGSYGFDSFAFHSFNHRTEDLSQLERVRKVDLRVKGYRPPQSRMGPELGDYELTYHNFEWLLSSAGSLGNAQPSLENGIVKIPVHLDDFELHRGGVDFSRWRDSAFELLERHPVAAIGLHDCYGRKWIGGYEALLADLKKHHAFWTCDDIARVVFTSPARATH